MNGFVNQILARLAGVAAAPAADPNPSPQPREVQAVPGLLSLLVPGLGQMYQGRIGKGVLFFVCIYTLFFYGMQAATLAFVAWPAGPITPIVVEPGQGRIRQLLGAHVNLGRRFLYSPALWLLLTVVRRR